MIYRRDYQSHIKSKESISITKPVTNSFSAFKVGDYITHNSFGVGKITKETPEYYVIRFDSINESKVISKKYKCLTIYEQKYIFHNNYKYGTILKEDFEFASLPCISIHVSHTERGKKKQHTSVNLVLQLHTYHHHHHLLAGPLIREPLHGKSS